MSTSLDGITWSSIRRIPIDSRTSGRDHFIPGLGVDRSSAGASARLALTYHYYPDSTCTSSTCKLNIGYISSTNGGSTWSAPTPLTAAMSLASLPNTSQGRMLGDYVSTSFLGGRAYPIVPVARVPNSGVFRQPMYVPTGGLAVAAGAASGASAPAPSQAQSPAAASPPSPATAR
jgi:hypothetical protein